MDKTLAKIKEELNQNLERIDCNTLDRIADAICEAKKVYTYGCGRSGFEMMSFGMRIMHLGKKSYYVHDTCVPPIKKGDLLLVASGSGNTESTVAVVKRAIENKAKVVLITGSEKSTIGDMSDIILYIPLYGYKTIQAQGNCYDQTEFVCLDTIIYKCMKKLKLEEKDMDNNHTNIE